MGSTGFSRSAGFLPSVKKPFAPTLESVFLAAPRPSSSWEIVAPAQAGRGVGTRHLDQVGPHVRSGGASGRAAPGPWGFGGGWLPYTDPGTVPSALSQSPSRGRWRQVALEMRIREVLSGPLVRRSYRAGEFYEAVRM